MFHAEVTAVFIMSLYNISHA